MLPLGLCIIWFLYLGVKGYELQQGKQGFVYILIFSAIIAAFYTLMLWMTRL